MSTDSPVTATDSSVAMAGGPNGQVILFGDSITENAFETEFCFSYAAAMSHGTQDHPITPTRLYVDSWQSRRRQKLTCFEIV
jgi:hypothetical protein